MRKCVYIFENISADVAELADALDSKSGGRKAVWVRPPPSAPFKFLNCLLLEMCIGIFKKCAFTPNQKMI